MPMDDTLNAKMESIERRWGGWNQYKANYFIRLDAKARANELMIFDNALNEEAYGAKSRGHQFSEHWTKRRELEAIIDCCAKARIGKRGASMRPQICRLVQVQGRAVCSGTAGHSGGLYHFREPRGRGLSTHFFNR